MNVTADMRNNGYFFMFKGPACPCRNGSAVEPHFFRHNPPVVGKYAIMNVDKILGMQRSPDQKNMFERNIADYKQGSSIQG